MDGYNAGSCMVSKTKTAAKANSGSIIQYQLALISPSASPRLTEVVQGNLGTSSKLNFFPVSSLMLFKRDLSSLQDCPPIHCDGNSQVSTPHMWATSAA